MVKATNWKDSYQDKRVAVLERKLNHGITYYNQCLNSADLLGALNPFYNSSKERCGSSTAQYDVEKAIKAH